MNYKVKVPKTAEMGEYVNIATRCRVQTLAQNARHGYNLARKTNGLPPVNKLPAGTIYTPIVEYILRGDYGYGDGWEDLTAEETYREAREQLKCYRENEGGRYRIVRRAVKD